MDRTQSGREPGDVRDDAYVHWNGRDKATHWILFAFALVVGLQAGGVIFDTMVNDPVWSDSISSARAWSDEIDTGTFYIAFSNAVMVLAVAALIVGWRSPRSIRTWLRVASILIIVAIVSTLLYFRPELEEIRGAAAVDIPDDELEDRIRRWSRLDPVREALVLIAFVASVRAVGLSHAAKARFDDARRSLR